MKTNFMPRRGPAKQLAVASAQAEVAALTETVDNLFVDRCLYFRWAQDARRNAPRRAHSLLLSYEDCARRERQARDRLDEARDRLAALAS